MLSFVVIRDPQWLLLSMVGVGFAWASILSLPYAMLSDTVPAAKMGVYMGIFNFFIVIPQLVARSEEHTSELQSLIRSSYAVFCLKKKNIPIYTRKYTTSN